MAIPFDTGEIRVVVTSCDGTVVVGACDEQYLAAHAGVVAELLKREASWAIEAYAAARTKIEANPDIYGWVVPDMYGWWGGGRIVAPALVDAGVAARVIARVVFEELGENIDEWGYLFDQSIEDRGVHRLKKFRPGAIQTFERLRDEGMPTYLVCSANPESMIEQLRLLDEAGEFMGAFVRGNAWKFTVTGAPAWLPQNIYFEGLRRKIHTRKGYYAGVLISIMLTHSGVNWSNMLVVGSIAELDLAMPVEMGAYGLLIRGPNTPAHELAWAQRHPRVQVIETLDEVLVTLGL